MVEDAKQQGEVVMHALAAAIRGADAEARIRDDADAFLVTLGVPQKDREQMLSMGSQRLLAYRSLVHNRVRNVVLSFLPRTKALLGAARLRADVTDFLAQRGIDSPYLRDVPNEFVRWASPRWERDDALHDAAGQLAAYELLSEDVPNDGRAVGEHSDLPLALDKQVRVNGSARLCRYTFDFSDVEAEAPVEASWRILAWRGTDHEYAEKVLNELGAALFEQLAAGRTLQEAIFAAAQAVGEPVADPLLERATYVLAEFMDAGALLGAEA